ncbi:hypothetical protein JXQ70_19090 [bacterium]|nr:hypothetical protein [bacterium]
MITSEHQAAKVIIGLDLGTTTIKAVALDNQARMRASLYVRHHGKPIEALKLHWSKLCGTDIFQLGVTGTNSGLNGHDRDFTFFDPVQCLMAGVYNSSGQVRNIIDIGGHNTLLIKCTGPDSFSEIATNSLCAAGTGSFLDEQAHRLGLTEENMSEESGVMSPPTVATRCAVFAKSDMIHRQQEGYTPIEVWSGMCRGLTHTCLNTLLRGKQLEGKVALTGGVTLNKEVVRWLSEHLGEKLVLPINGHLIAALGAALLSVQHGRDLSTRQLERHFFTGLVTSKKIQERRPALLIKKSEYPDFSHYPVEQDEYGNEVRTIRTPAEIKQAFMGIDIGSTSTKLVLIDTDGEPFIDFYRKTGGDPVLATKKLFWGVRSLLQSSGARIQWSGCSTTGSGRQLIGKIVGADVIINEITAHLIGAIKQDPDIETIFEIGGQDAKFMRVSNQQVRDTVMNYVCAAGTGSFLEEIAHKFDFAVQEMGEVTQGISPPYTSDRCTVFMEQDIHQLIREGSTREEAMAAVLYSVAQNYLGKVVGNRPCSKEKILFLGATARNRGLVAAFENILGVKMIVPLFCHVMGAWGAALRVRELWQKGVLKTTAFRSLDVADRTIELKSNTCDLCQNHCKITTAMIEGLTEKPSWGYLCGRDPEENFEKKNSQYDLFQHRLSLMAQKPKAIADGQVRAEIAYPLCLTSFFYFSLWRSFFRELRIELFSLPKTNETIKAKAIAAASAEFCFPVKVAHGHVQEMITRGKKHIFIPAMIGEERNTWTSDSLFCPYVTSLPSIIQAQLNRDPAYRQVIIQPVIDLRLSSSNIAQSLFEALQGTYPVTLREIRSAWDKALTAQRAFEQHLETHGQSELEKIKGRGGKAIVVLGRPYNVYDLGINLKLPRKIADFGYQLVPFDCLPFRPDLLGTKYWNTYWSYGQRILSAAVQIAADPDLFPIMFTNFNCGPDSFLLTYLEEIFADKPFLVLELDEHGADTGYGTRIEAFFEMVAETNSISSHPVETHKTAPAIDFKKKKLWIPPMHPYAFLAAAAFRSYGYDAEALPNESRTSFGLGRSLCRGGECLPTAATLGAMIEQLHKVEQAGLDTSNQALFMPTASGPCRFGQYEHLHRLKIHEAGYDQVSILTPSSLNTYQGLEQPLRRRLFQVLLMVDLLFKAVLKRRPYEKTTGTVDTIIDEQLPRLEQRIINWSGHWEMFTRIIRSIEHIPYHRGRKPLVGVVGEIYVRLNPFCNDHVVEVIEAEGGEAWVAPMTEWVLYTSLMERWKLKNRRSLSPKRWLSILKNLFLVRNEHEIYRLTSPFLEDRREPSIDRVVSYGARYVPPAFEGETILTIGRTLCFLEQGADLVVNCAPFSCMPGNITSAILTTIQQETGIPIISTFYDGEEGANDTLRIYLNNIREAGCFTGPEQHRLQPCSDLAGA